MVKAAAVLVARPHWVDCMHDLAPGAHVAVFADAAWTAVEGRLAGLELRDTLLVLRPGPTSGFVFLFRQPLAEKTVAAQVLATGTGALHIEAGRVGTGEDKGVWPITGRAAARNSMAGPMRAAETDTTVGRWPPNVLLVHGPGCQRAGIRRVQTGVAHRSHSGGKSFGSERPKPKLPDMTYAEEDGLETCVAYDCESGCPVHELDKLSGELTSHGGGTSKGIGYESTAMGVRAILKGDSGGASRFFPQFESEAELREWVERLVGVV